MRAAPCLLFLAAALVAGCGVKSEPKAELQPTFPVTVEDAAGRDVVLEDAARRVVAVGPSSGRLVRLLGTKAAIVPQGTPPGRLVERRPDLVVLPAGDAGRADQIAKGAGAPAFVMAEVQLAPLESALAALGLATGHAVRGRNLALELRGRRREVTRRLEGTRPVKVFIDLGLQIPAPRGSLIANLARRAGGRQVGPDGPGAASPAELHKADPDVYLVPHSSGITLEQLRRNPATADLRAVQEGRVVVLDDRLVSADDRAYDALERLAAAFHPEAFR